MSWFRKFVYFCVQVDRDELEQTGSPYERTLIYASFMRQMLGAFFVFAVFLYAWSILLPLWMAIAISALLAAIVFFIDQAIISSEWMFHREFFRYWILNAPINFFFKLLQLLPRAVYAVIIAAFMSTLAEITIQSRTIERSLREATREANQEYFQQKDTLQANQRAEIEQIEVEIIRLEEAIALSSDPNIQQSIAVLNSNTVLAQEEINTLTASITGLRNRLGPLESEASGLRSEVQQIRGRIAQQNQQMRLEVEDPTRCPYLNRANFTESMCEGPNWRRHRDLRNAAQRELAVSGPELEAVETELSRVRADLQNAQAALGGAQTQFQGASRELREVQTTTQDLPILQADLTTQETLLADTRTAHAAALTSLEEELRATGYYEEADYGPLELYVGLKRLHHPPIPDGATDVEIAQLELEGEAARAFSNGLWYVIILFELSPVLVAFLGSPFSHLAMRMRRKRDDAQRDDLADRLQKDHDIQEKYAKERVYQAKSRQNMQAELKAHSRQTKLQEAQLKGDHDRELRSLANQRKQEKEDAKQDLLSKRAEAKASRKSKLDKRVQQSRQDRDLLDLEIEKQRQMNELQELRHQHQFGEELVPNGAEQPSANLKGDKNV